MSKTLLAALFAVLLLALGACSSSDDSGSGGSGSSDSTGSSSSAGKASPSASPSASADETKAASSIADSLMQAQKSTAGTSQFLTMDRKDAACIGTGLVDKVGTDKLQTYGLLADDFTTKNDVANVRMSAPDAKAATGVLFDCTDVESMMKTAMNKSGTIPQQMMKCVNQVMTEKNLRPLFTQIFQGKQAAAQKALTTPLLSCAKGSAGQ